MQIPRHRTDRRQAGCGAAAALALILASAAPLAQPASPERHFLWAVSDASGAEAWLLGSVHVLAARHYPLSPVIEQAFAQAQTFVAEIDLDELDNPATMLAVTARALLPPGRRLEQLVSAETMAAVRARAAARDIPLELLQRMKPWMVAVTLTAAELSSAGFDARLGVDRHFFDRARSAGLPRRALETVDYQFARFDGLPDHLQERSLVAMLADLERQTSDLDAVADAWRRGDVAAIEALLHEGFRDAPELAERLLYERNRNWVPAIERCLAERARCFVVVGAAHLVGPGSLVSLLRERRLSVVQR